MSAIGSTSAIANPSSSLSSLNADMRSQQAAIATLENEVATGVAVPTPSSDPAKAVQVVSLDSQVARAQQYSANAQDGLSRLGLVNSTLGSVVSSLQQVVSAVDSLSGVTGDSAGAAVAVASTVSDTLGQLIGLANTQYAGQALFSGTGSPSAAYAATGKYLGAGTAPTVTVASGTTAAVSVTGPEVFGATGPTEKTGLLSKTGVLATIAKELGSGTAASIAKATTTGLAALQSSFAKVQNQASAMGAAQQAMQGWANRASGVASALSQQLSDVRDVTMAEAVTNLQSQQTSYQAALYVASQLHTDSLVNYL